MTSAVVLGIDIGTSGARSVAMDANGGVVAQHAASLADFGPDGRDPALWWAAVEQSLFGCLASVDRSGLRAIAVDGTSGTVLAAGADGTPLGVPLMYNDAVNEDVLVARIAPMIPEDSAAHGATSGLAKMLVLRQCHRDAILLHQADWIAGRLSGRFDVTDENNALKSGYDPVAGRWPVWVADTGLALDDLPRVLPPGERIGPIAAETARRFDLPGEVCVLAGTTDGCASFLATGASALGDGVTVLGSSLTLKLLSATPIFAPRYGIYSHRLLGMWLAGGASNSGGKVLAQFFDGDALDRLSATLDPTTETGLNYYPLLRPGERFPVMDPVLPPRLAPRPSDDATFLKGMLEGIAEIERLGYARLAELGAPPLATVRSVGGGAGNPQWTAMRGRMLGVPLIAAASVEAAAGTARLALAGARRAGMLS